jgi:lipoprotein-releasing system ATP-binding protein
VLADEPTGNLDRDTARAVFDVFVQLAKSRSTAVVIVTHDPEMAARCDRIMRLKEGRLAPA